MEDKSTAATEANKQVLSGVSAEILVVSVPFSGTAFSRARRDGKAACALAARRASALSPRRHPPKL